MEVVQDLFFLFVVYFVNGSHGLTLCGFIHFDGVGVGLDVCKVCFREMSKNTADVLKMTDGLACQLQQFITSDGNCEDGRITLIASNK